MSETSFATHFGLHTMVGWGTKLSFRPAISSLSNWKLRRFELTPSRFSYSTEQGVLRGTIPRSTLVFAESIDNFLLPHRRGEACKYYPFAIRLYVGQTPFYFCVPTEKKRQAWLNSFNLPCSGEPSSKSLFLSISSENSPFHDQFDILHSEIDLNDEDDSTYSFSVASDDSFYKRVSFFRRHSTPYLADHNIDLCLLNTLTQYIERSERPTTKDTKSEYKKAAEISWNKDFQLACASLFIPRNLDEAQLCGDNMVPKLELLEHLRDIETSFSETAAQAFLKWLEKTQFTTGVTSSKKFESFHSNGIHLKVATSPDPLLRQSFRKQLLQSQIECGSIMNNIWQFYEMYLASCISKQQLDLTRELELLTRDLETLQLDPLGVCISHATDLKARISVIKSTPFDWLETLPVAFPLTCLIDYLGYSVLAVGEIDSFISDSASIDDLKADVSAFVNTTLSNPSSPFPVELEELHGCCYISPTSNTLPLEDYCIWELQADDSFWRERNQQEMRIRPELLAHHQLESSILSLSSYLHEELIPKFARNEEVCADGVLLCNNLHQEGINLRHMGKIYEITKNHSQKASILLEMTARALSNCLSQFFRSASSLDDCKHIWYQWREQIVCKAWWESLEASQCIVAKYWPSLALQDLPFGSVNRSSLLNRMQSLIGFEENEFLAVMHRMNLYSFPQVIQAQHYYELTTNAPLSTHLQSYSLCVQDSFRNTNKPFNSANFTQKFISLYQISILLQRDENPPLAILYEVLHRCKECILRSIRFQFDHILAHFVLGSVQATIATLVAEHSSILQECHETQIDGRLLLLEALCCFQRVLLLSDVSSSHRSYIDIATVKKMALSAWQTYLPSTVSSHIEEGNEFQLILYQLEYSGCIYVAEHFDEQGICLNEKKFIDKLLTSDFSQPHVHDSVFFCLSVICSGADHPAVKELYVALANQIYTGNYHFPLSATQQQIRVIYKENRFLDLLRRNKE